MPPTEALAFQWFETGEEAFAAAGAAIGTARQAIELEVYACEDSPLARRVREQLTAAARRGVRVRVLVDAIGSILLPQHFWQPLLDAGGAMRWFNPLSLERFAIRDHRKLLVCDGQVAFLGGFNIAAEYDGDGVTRGWRDIALRVEGSLASELTAAFDRMFERADFRHKRIFRLRRFGAKQTVPAPDWKLLLAGPGRGRNPILRALYEDLAEATEVRIMTPYFLPTRRLLRLLNRTARRGGQVQLLLPGKSDVLLSRLAAQSLYGRLLRAGVEVFEYQPQILHAKLILVNGVCYVGSANLDPRSLRINYELMVRFDLPALSAQGMAIFARTLAHARRLDRTEWRRCRTWWEKLKQRLAHFLLARLDPYVVGWQYRKLKQKLAGPTTQRAKATR